VWAEEIHLTAKVGQQITMDEDLMRAFRIKPVQVPTLDIWNGKKLVLSFKPKGLWVLGANGAIEILSEKNLFVLADAAERFQQPQWYIIKPGKKSANMEFTRDTFLTLLEL
jgi:hypothetical protein